jgi:DNA-directed RNA polymerase specialized sigma24 family protein
VRDAEGDFEDWYAGEHPRLVASLLLVLDDVEPIVPAPAGEAWDLVRDLAPRQRTAVVLRYVADLTEADIAVVMGVSRGTVSSTLIDARRVIARRLEAMPEGVEDRHG